MPACRLARRGAAITEYAASIALVALALVLMLLVYRVATGELYQRVSASVAPTAPGQRGAQPLPYSGGGGSSGQPQPGDSASGAANDEPPDTGAASGGQAPPMSTGY